MAASLKLGALCNCFSRQVVVTSDADIAAYACREQKTLTKIISLDKSTHPYLMQAKTASKALIRAFDDKVLYRRLIILRSLCSIKL